MNAKQMNVKNLRVIVISAAIVFIAAILGVAIASCGRSPEASAKNDSAVSDTAQKAIDKSNPPDSVSVRDPMLTLGVGESSALDAYYDSGRAPEGAAYSSDKPDVVSVDPETGEMKAEKEGYAIVTAKSFNDLTANCYVTVKKAPSKAGFPVSGLQLQKGERTTLTLSPTAKDEGFSKAELSSGDSDVVEIADSGEITAKGEGTAVVTATAYNGCSAEISVTVLDNSGFTDRTTVSDTTLRQEAGWNFTELAEVPANSEVRQYGKSDDGRWLHVKFNDTYGWIYNKAFEDVKNYDDFTLDTLPAMADDLLFEIGTDKRDIFDFVYNISYGTQDDDTDENLCVEYFKTGRGSCYHHGAMLCYLYNRCGYETLRLVGLSAYDGVSEHSWCISKTENGWKHVDAQYFSIRDADSQFFVDDYSQYFNWDRDKFPETGK